MPNADGTGYYRFALDDAGWQALIENAADLASGGSTGSGRQPRCRFPRGSRVRWDVPVRAGGVGKSRYLGCVGCGHDELSKALPRLLKTTSCPPLNRRLQKIVKPRFEMLAGTTGSGNELLQQRMQRFLIVIAKDQAMREPLARQAALRLGLDGDPDPDGCFGRRARNHLQHRRAGYRPAIF